MDRKTRYAMLLTSLLTVSLILRADEGAQSGWGRLEVLPFPNGSFDEGERHWFFSRERGAQTRATAEYVFTPPGALRLYADHDTGIGARVDSALVPVKGAGPVELHFEVCTFAGRYLGLDIRQYDADKQYLDITNWGQPGSRIGIWQTNIREVLLDERAAYIQLRLLAYPRAGETIDMFFDDFRLIRPPMRIPPWPSQYKIRPEETDRLTAADVVGPDGIVYPNWTQVGVRGGIPDVPVVIRLADRGAQPGSDIADLLEQACRDAAAAGGGAVLIDAGTYHLGRQVVIRRNGVVIRGAGRDKTKLIFTYAVGNPGRDVGFAWPEAGGAVGPDTQVEVHAYHLGLKRLVLFRDGNAVKEQVMDGARTYALKVPGTDLLKAGGAGTAALRVEAEYMNGRRVSAERQVEITEAAQPVKALPLMQAALFFSGAGMAEPQCDLMEDGKRGDTTLRFAGTADWKVGDKIYLHAPMTDRFCELIQDRSPRGWNRLAFLEIIGIDGNTVTIDHPLRIDYPVIDGTFARRLRVVERCGVEALTIEHQNRLPIDSVQFSYAWDCWARNVRIVKTGRNGLYAHHVKRIEFRDCELDRAWNNDGGQAYAGFTRGTECLMESCVVRGYRHGPIVQFGAMGNVFRNSLFDGSDLQWHAGWSTENLFENCVVNSRRGTGSYGYGAYATGSADVVHGPNGPRNVVYNCDITSEREGVWLDGVNEHWLFLHNRFVVGKGAGFVATRGSFDHIIRNNVFILQDGVSPMVRLLTPDCVGIDLIGNTLVGGNGRIVAGAAVPAIELGNRTLPAAAVMAARPQADPPSIYDWQQRLNQSRMGP